MNAVNENDNALGDKITKLYDRVVALPICQKACERLSPYPPTTQKVIIAVALILLMLVVIAALYLFFGTAIALGFVASILAGLATGIGALPALFMTKISDRLFNTLLGGAAGVMLAATAFALILPGEEYGNAIWPGKGILLVTVGMILGAIFLDYTDRKMPHIQFHDAANADQQTLRKIWLFIIAITVHNFPEGLAVGVSFAGGDINNGIALATAIGLQNIPEGMAVAMPLVAIGYDRRKAVLIATMTGLVEPVGGFLGVTLVAIFNPIIPIAMGFAAGAMLFVIVEEIIPQTQSNGKARHATIAVIVGFIVMMLMESLLG